MRQGLKFLKSLYSRSYKDFEILSWIKERRDAVVTTLTEIDIKDLKSWTFNEYGLSHDSGKFYQIQLRRNEINGKHWDQPIINQPEIGILGFITTEIKGVLHFLVQAKIEPGNINIVQLSPTVQSTKSNFTKVHGGSLTPFVEYFLHKKSHALVDQLQSEQGSRFYQKRNRNIIIEINEYLEHPNYIWLTLGDIVAMTKHHNTVNMDTRTVISCIHFGSYLTEALELKTLFNSSENGWIDSMLRRDVYQHSYPEILSRITESKFRREHSSKIIKLNETRDWIYEDGKIVNIQDKYFDVVGYDIHIENRETTNWNQPLIKPKGEGICCFFAKKFDGVYHLLVQLKDEIGSFDGVEMAPTIQLSNENLKESKYYKIFKSKLNTDAVLFDTMQSEEGGRFYQEQNRNMIIEVNDDISLDDNFMWMTVQQLKTFLQYNNYVNIQSRSIIASLPL
jgi:oxidase EvaA